MTDLAWRATDDEGAGGRRVIGLIAQEVQKVLPDVVYQDPVTGYLSVAYTVHYIFLLLFFLSEKQFYI
jgi:hypothetical protein